MLAACSSGAGTPPAATTPSDEASDPSLPACQYPKAIGYPDWMPKDLPLPAGAYAYQETNATGPYLSATFAVKEDLSDLVRFILEEWPKRGWTLGQGDAEADEAEDTFGKPPASGAFKAQGQQCSPGLSVLLIFYAPKGLTSPPASPITNPGSPLLSPTPS
jgi:hypothetical protein